MLPAAVEQITARLPESAQVLDVGGWGAPFNRADWVIDAQPHGTRGPDGHHGTAWESFTDRTWVQRDLCDRTPWPFRDDQFDLAVCVSVLEQVRDPVWVCAELSRVARAGYVEMTTVEAELLDDAAAPGHRWLCELESGELVFTHKPHAVHHDATLRVSARWAATLTAEDKRLGLFWETHLPARERLLVGPEHDAALGDLRRRLRQRFEPTGAELRVQQARDAAQIGLDFARGPARSAAERVWQEVRRRSG